MTAVSNTTPLRIGMSLLPKLSLKMAPRRLACLMVTRLVQVIVLIKRVIDRQSLVRVWSFGERWLAWWALTLGGCARSLGGRWLSASGRDARGDARLLDGHSLGAGACADRKSD